MTLWPRCKCGGLAVFNASGDITRTCIRCGSLVQRAAPLKPQMGEQLYNIYRVTLPVISWKL